MQNKNIERKLVILPIGSRNSFIVSIFFLLIGFSLAFYTYFEITNGLNSVRWPIAYGMVIASKVEPPFGGFESPRVYTPRVRYQYSVHDSNYVGQRISFAQISGQQEWAEDIIRTYPVGKKIEVFYNPRNPSVPVLEPTKSLPILLRAKALNIILSFMFVIPAGIFYWIHQRSKGR